MHRIKKELGKHRFFNHQKYLKQMEIGDNDLWKMNKRILKEHEIIHNIQPNSKAYFKHEKKCESSSRMYIQNNYL